MDSIASVHQETLNQNRNVHEWESISFSEVSTLKLLIKRRAEIDPFHIMKEEEEISCYSTNGVPVFYELIEVIYLDLDALIKQTELTNKQLWLLNKLMRGYTEADLAKALKMTNRSIMTMLDTICNRLQATNERNWLNWLETSGNKKTTMNYKECKKCHEIKAVHESEFYVRPDNSGDGFNNICITCKKKQKRDKGN